MTDVDVLIAGAGPAGAALACHLAPRHLGAVHLCDARAFPRATLCGEFLSPEVMAYLEALGGLDHALIREAPRISEAVLVAPSVPPVSHALSRSALGISRDVFDLHLTTIGRSRGVRWRPGTRVLRVEADPGSDGRCHRVVLLTGGRTHEITARAVVNATGGTWGTSGRSAGRVGERGPARVPSLVAFKRHYRPRGDLPPGIDGRITLFIFAGGYLGISPIGSGRVNICFLPRTSNLRAVGGRPDGVLSWIGQQHPRLERWLEALEPEGSFLSSSGIRFGLRAAPGPALAIGDAMGMIPPLAGDGIAMAMRSAELAAPLLSRYLSDDASWGSVRTDYARVWRREFGQRMRVARAVHRIAARPAGARALRLVDPIDAGLGSGDAGGNGGRRCGRYRTTVKRTRSAGRPGVEMRAKYTPAATVAPLERRPSHRRSAPALEVTRAIRRPAAS